MAKVKVINNNLDTNLNGQNFLNTASQTIFRFGSFSLTSNFDGRTFVDYSKELSTFVKPVTLDNLGLNETESDVIYFKDNNAVLNLDNTDLNTFVKFGSAYELLRVSIQNIISNYPGSLFVNSQFNRGGNISFSAFTYNEIENISTFHIPSKYTVNKFGLVFNVGNEATPDNNELKNLNLSYYRYVVWNTERPDDNSHTIVEFTGDTPNRQYVIVKCLGNPFPSVTGGTTVGDFDIHLKPNTRIFDEFRAELNDFEQYMVSSREETNGFLFTLKDPTALDNGQIIYNDNELLWETSDGYNVDTDTPSYTRFLEIILTIGNKYDEIKTDLIARFLTPASLQTYDLTDENKTAKLLKIYGAEFDQLKQFIDSLVYINRTTYDKKNNLPDQLVSNLARTFGWDYFQLVKEEELVDRIFGFEDRERDLFNDPLPAEVDIELWRRILINTNYYWKSKGTRDAIKSMFLLIGIPEPFINITEYVYTVDGRIDPREVELTLDDLPSVSLPYDSDGYPIAPVESNNFFFQISGDTDSGQAYMNNFRNVGFTLLAQIDNKKSWIQTGATYRDHYSSPQYYQQDSKLVLNTKEVDIALDTARGIEYDVYRYIKEFDFPANSTGTSVPYTFVNVSLDLSATTQYKFTLPETPVGDVEVRYNGTLLTGPKVYTGTTTFTATTEYDYYFPDPVGEPRKFEIPALAGPFDLTLTGPTRDVIEATLLYESGTGISKITVRYVVVRIFPNTPDYTTIDLPDVPQGDVQLTINGIAATQGTPQFSADYVVNPNNPQQLIIQNPVLISYLKNVNPVAQVAFITISGESLITARQEISRVDTLCGGKIYFNSKANKSVYRLNYRVIDPKSVKILVDGIALEPGSDYTVNPNNPYEIYLPPSVGIGNVVSAYYLIGDNTLFNPIISDSFGLGDITRLSFMEFIELVQRKLVNARNRKVITNHRGGWYPTLLKVYITYLKRANVDPESDLHSNGYTFENLYPFLNKYNAFFQRFVQQLLPATIIQKKSGLMIRNTVFTKQKFTYKRGVSFDSGLNYFGDDGATYLKRPLQQDAEWTDDVVYLPEICDDFEVDDVNIIYPTTTTTTTAFPLETVLYITETFTQANSISDGNEITTRYELDFSPAILIGYSIEIDLDFTIILENTASGDLTAFAEIEVRKNGSLIYNTNQVENGSTGGVPIVYYRSTTVLVETGDVIEVTLYNSAVAEDPGVSESETRLSPDGNNAIVTPNGEVSIVIPTFESNKASYTN